MNNREFRLRILQAAVLYAVSLLEAGYVCDIGPVLEQFDTYVKDGIVTEDES